MEYSTINQNMYKSKVLIKKEQSYVDMVYPYPLNLVFFCPNGTLVNARFSPCGQELLSNFYFVELSTKFCIGRHLQHVRLRNLNSPHVLTQPV